MTLEYNIHELAPYINWVYFFHAWGVKAGCDAATELRRDAEQQLTQWEGEGVCGQAAFLLSDCHSEGDDIVLADGGRIALLRQQTSKDGAPCLCLSDFINPRGDKIGLFCCTCHAACGGDEYTALLKQTVADRLAEATAERMHLDVRRTLWGYAPDEALTIEELHAERFDGIRPAVGYPSLPDQSLNFVLNDILHFDQIGITLTENGAMMPHASVSGMMISHPAARYFAVGRIGQDQLHDYAARRGLTTEYLRPFLNL